MGCTVNDVLKAVAIILNIVDQNMDGKKESIVNACQTASHIIGLCELDLGCER